MIKKEKPRSLRWSEASVMEIAAARRMVNA